MAEQMRPDVAADVGKRIRALRTSAQLTVATLAERSGVSRRMVTQVELGQANPSIGTVDKIAAALGTTFAALVGLLPEPSADGVEIWSTPRGSWAYLLKATETPDMSVELWKWRIVSDDRYQAAGSTQPPDSIVHVLHGSLRVRLDAKVVDVGEAESARIAGSSSKVFEAASPATEFLWVVMIPRT